jgi:hypothetical protein
MRRELQAAVKEGQMESIYGNRKLTEYEPAKKMRVPNWLRQRENVTA